MSNIHINRYNTLLTDEQLSKAFQNRLVHEAHCSVWYLGVNTNGLDGFATVASVFA